MIITRLIALKRVFWHFNKMKINGEGLRNNNFCDKKIFVT
jgi:hypothetical protein